MDRPPNLEPGTAAWWEWLSGCVRELTRTVGTCRAELARLAATVDQLNRDLARTREKP